MFFLGHSMFLNRNLCPVKNMENVLNGFILCQILPIWFLSLILLIPSFCLVFWFPRFIFTLTLFTIWKCTNDFKNSYPLKWGKCLANCLTIWNNARTGIKIDLFLQWIRFYSYSEFGCCWNQDNRIRKTQLMTVWPDGRKGWLFLQWKHGKNIKFCEKIRKSIWTWHVCINKLNFISAKWSKSFFYISICIN
jgi:hypothetical protein